MGVKWHFYNFLQTVIIPYTFLTKAEAIDIFICEDKRYCRIAKTTTREANGLISGKTRLAQDVLERINGWSDKEISDRINLFLFNDLNKCIASLIQPSNEVKERIEQTTIKEWQELYDEKKAMDVIIASFRLSIICDIEEIKMNKQIQTTNPLPGVPPQSENKSEIKGFLRILHLSDLHFKSAADGSDSEIRTEYIESFFEELKKASKDKIDYLCFTGDVANRGIQKDYINVESVFREILSITNIEPDHVLVCPGNHDQFVDASVSLYPTDQNNANQYLRIENLKNLSSTFSAFSRFCEKMRFQKYEIRKNTKSYLVGVRQFEDLTVACINTAWLSVGKEGNDFKARPAWIGNAFATAVNNRIPKDTANPVLTIMHHPVREWAEQECNSFTGSTNVWKKISTFSNYVLCGHTHQISSNKEVFNNARVLHGGCLYENSDPTYETSFSLYTIPIGDNTCLHIEKHYIHDGDWIEIHRNE